MKRLNKNELLELLMRCQDGRATCMYVLEKIEEGTDELIDLLTSARAIAERKGADTAWERFSERLAKAGIGSVTAKVFKVLPSDLESAAEGLGHLGNTLPAGNVGDPPDATWPDAYGECPDCDGRGWNAQQGIHDSQPEQVQCPRCEGSGVQPRCVVCGGMGTLTVKCDGIPHTAKCPDCNGSGFAPTETPTEPQPATVPLALAEGLAEALEECDPGPEYPIAESTHGGAVICELSVDDVRGIRKALAAYRANHPKP